MAALSISSAAPAQAKEAAALPNVTLHESSFKLEWMESPWDDVRRAGDWLLPLERLARPDMVHLNGTLSHGSLPWRAPVLVAGA